MIYRYHHKGTGHYWLERIDDDGAVTVLPMTTEEFWATWDQPVRQVWADLIASGHVPQQAVPA